MFASCVNVVLSEVCTHPMDRFQDITQSMFCSLTNISHQINIETYICNLMKTSHQTNMMAYTAFIEKVVTSNGIMRTYHILDFPGFLKPNQRVAAEKSRWSATLATAGCTAY